MSDTTYKSLIAQGILGALGVKMSIPEIEKMLDSNDDFYRVLLRIESHVKQMELIMDQTVDMQNYVQTRLANIVFAEFSLRAKEGEANNEEVAETMSAKTLSNMQNKFEADATNINRSKEELALSKNEMRAMTREMLAAWKKLNASGGQAQFIAECKQKAQGKIDLYVEKRKQYVALLEETFKAAESIELYLGKFSTPALYRVIQANSNAESVQPEIEPVFQRK